MLVKETTFGSYFSRVRGLIFNPLRSVVDSSGVDISQFDSLGGINLSLDIPFSDGSILAGIETFSQDRRTIRVVSYGYEFCRPSGFFFLYEMERSPGSENDERSLEDQIWKCCWHVHVGAKKGVADKLQGFPPDLREHGGPHFGTFPVSLDYVLAVIIVNYYPQVSSVLSQLDLACFLGWDSCDGLSLIPSD